MKFAEAQNVDGLLIRAYGPGRVSIGDRIFDRALVVMGNRIDSDWGPANAEALSPDHLHIVAELQPEVVLLGTGARQIFPPAQVCLPITQRGIGLEIMDTAAACRTYNILAAEGRRVAAAILMI